MKRDGTLGQPADKPADLILPDPRQAPLPTAAPAAQSRLDPDRAISNALPAGRSASFNSLRRHTLKPKPERGGGLLGYRN